MPLYVSLTKRQIELVNTMTPFIPNAEDGGDWITGLTLAGYLGWDRKRVYYVAGLMKDIVAAYPHDYPFLSTWRGYLFSREPVHIEQYREQEQAYMYTRLTHFLIMTRRYRDGLPASERAGANRTWVRPLERMIEDYADANGIVLGK